MKGFTMVENANLQKLKARYCTLQYMKRTIQDQQMLIREEMNQIENDADAEGRL
jgi:hypothetical protein